MSPSPNVWLQAARPATLPAIVGPVLVGAAAGIAVGAFRPLVFTATLAAALLIQVGSNLANDVSDFERGVDAPGRLGPRRVTQSGQVTPVQMRRALAVVFGAAAVLGLYLAWVGGWPIVVVGMVSIVAAITYTGGPWPFGYHGLGDLFVFLFFGLVAVVGTCYLQTGAVSALAVAAALAPSCTVTAILVINNLRDIHTDEATGKRTLAVILGDRLTRIEYAVLMLAPFALVTVLAAAGVFSWWTLLVWIALSPVVIPVRRVLKGESGRDLNLTLKRTAQLHLLVSLLLAVGVSL